MRVKIKVPAALAACPALMPSPIPRASLAGLGWVGQEYIQGGQRWREVSPGVCDLSAWVDVSDGNQDWRSQGQVPCPWGAPPPPAPVPTYAPAPAMPVPAPTAIAPSPVAPKQPAPSPALPSPAPSPSPAPGTTTTVYGAPGTASSGPIAGDGLAPGSLSLTGDALGPLIGGGGGDAGPSPIAPTAFPWWLLVAGAAAGLLLFKRKRS